MAVVRLLQDAPEGAPGQEVRVGAQRAADLVAAKLAERVIVREVVVERTVATEKRRK